MTDILRAWVGRSFRNRIFVAMLAATLLPLLVCGGLMLNLQVVRSQESLAQESHAQLAALGAALDDFRETCRDIAGSLADSTVVHSALRRGGGDSRTLYQVLYRTTEPLRPYARFDIYDGQGVCCYTTASAPPSGELDPGWGVLWDAGQEDGLALRAGAESCTLVYRRTKKYMPADAEELELALADGVRFLELAAPVGQGDGRLVCRKMALGAPDASGRRTPVETEETLELPCDTVISAVGERVDSDLLASLGVETGENGRPAFRTNLENVYAAGDVLRGPATVVEGIADAAAFAELAAGAKREPSIPGCAQVGREEALARKGILCLSAKREGERCLQCGAVCETCAGVCPNRANVVIPLPDGRRQILHVDRMCNECGNCQSFCPYDSAPYRDKLTLFHDRAGFDESGDNQGFLPLGDSRVLVRLNGRVEEIDLDAANDLPADVETLIYTVLSQYRYLL